MPPHHHHPAVSPVTSSEMAVALGSFAVKPSAKGGVISWRGVQVSERGQLQLDALERTDERVAWASGGSTRLWRRKEGGESIVVKLLPLTDKRLRDEAMRELETLYVQRLSF